MQKSMFLASVKFGCVAALALTAFSANMRAGLIGDSVSVTYNFPNIGTVSKSFGTFTVTGAESLVNTFNDATLGFSNTQITLTNTTPGAFNVNSFDGYVILLLTGPSFVNVTEDAASSAAFVPGSVLSFSANQISLNVAGTCAGCVGGEKIILDVTTAPEPSSIALTGFALIGLGGVMFHRRRKSA